MATWADIQKYIPSSPPANYGAADEFGTAQWESEKPVNIPGFGPVIMRFTGTEWTPVVDDPQSRTQTVLRPGKNGEILQYGVPYGDSSVGGALRDLAPAAMVAFGAPMLGASIAGLGGAGEAAALETLGVGLPTEISSAGIGGLGSIAGSGVSPEVMQAMAEGYQSGAALTPASGTNVANYAGVMNDAGEGLVPLSGPAAPGGGIVSGLRSYGPGLAAGGLLAALTGSKLSGGSTTSTSSFPPMSQEEKDLIELNKKLAQKQLGAIDAATGYQKQYSDIALAELRRQKAQSDAYAGVNTPEKIAADAELQRKIETLQYESAKAAADRAAKLGPVQEELLNLQLEQLRQGGRATPEQLAAIKEAADVGIAAGNFDIDAATERGIGLIADQMANSRGLRLTDSPMSSEAALLAREGVIQKGSLEKNLRSGQATAALNYPLAVQQVQTAGIQGQQSIADAAANFQAELQNRAYQNRLALTGNASSSGIGLAGINSGNGALSALTQARLNSGTSTVNKGIGLSDIGSLAQGLGTGYLAYNRLGLGL